MHKGLQETINLVWFWLFNLYQVFQFLEKSYWFRWYNMKCLSSKFEIWKTSGHLIFSLWIDFGGVLCHGRYQEARKLVEVFGGSGRQSETAGQLYYYLTFIQQAHASWVKNISILQTGNLEMERLETNSIDYIPVNTARKFYKIE